MAAAGPQADAARAEALAAVDRGDLAKHRHPLRGLLQLRPWPRIKTIRGDARGVGPASLDGPLRLARRP